MGRQTYKSGTNATSSQIVEAASKNVVYEDGQTVTVNMVPVSNRIELEPIKDMLVQVLDSSESPETPDYPINRVATIAIPIPTWLVGAPQGIDMQYTCEFWVDPDEQRQVYSSDPSSWIVEVNTNKLYGFVVPVATHFFAGNAALGYPARWLLTLAGLLGPLIDRPKFITLSCSYKSKQLTQTYFDWDVLSTIEADDTRITPAVARVPKLLPPPDEVKPTDDLLFDFEIL